VDAGMAPESGGGGDNPEDGEDTDSREGDAKAVQSGSAAPPARSGRNAARISAANSSGSSHAAK